MHEMLRSKRKANEYTVLVVASPLSHVAGVICRRAAHVYTVAHVDMPTVEQFGIPWSTLLEDPLHTSTRKSHSCQPRAKPGLLTERFSNVHICALRGHQTTI